jgi:hypothetical protein
VHGHTDGFTEPFKATGDGGRLNLRINIPLRNVDTATVSGNIAFDRTTGSIRAATCRNWKSVTGVVGSPRGRFRRRASRRAFSANRSVLDIDSAAARPRCACNWRDRPDNGGAEIPICRPPWPGG